MFRVACPAVARFGVSAASTVRYVDAVDTTGTVEAKPQGSDPYSHRIEAFGCATLATVAPRKDISLVELAEMLRAEYGMSFEASTVWRGIDSHDITFKRIACAADQDRPDIAVRRPAWFEAQPNLDSRRPSFLR